MKMPATKTTLPGAPNMAIERTRRPEILAPAGDPLALRAALAAGADAVYLGMARFNARGRAERFRGVSLEACVRAACKYGVRVHVTLNTLLQDDELPLALSLAKEAFEAGAHAAIVQDAGFASLLRERLPGLALHGSTQMTIHQADQAAQVVESLGLKRIIVARECSVEEVRCIAERIRPLGADVEVFVHGALCFAYSGQCLMSNFAGRRSANRGICAQNCRFDFTAGPVHSKSSFHPLPLFDRRQASQLISMKDLAAFDSVAALADAGVGSFKIEGRLKGPEYVAEVTRLYHAAIDAWEASQPFAADAAESAAGRVFSRGFTNGYLGAQIDPTMRGDKRSLEGEPDATVLAANRNTAVITLAARPGHLVRAGQGYRYAHDRYRGGFLVLAVDPLRDGGVKARVRFGADTFGRTHRRGASGRRRPPPPLPRGLACYLNSDPELTSRIEKLVGSVTISKEPDRTPTRLVVSGLPGEPLRIHATTQDGRVAEVVTREALQAARTRPLDKELLTEHLGRLGGTSYRLESVDSSGLSPGVFLGFPLLHAARSEIVARLDGQTVARAAVPTSAPGTLEMPGPEARPRLTTLCVCVGSRETRDAAAAAGADRIVLESSAMDLASAEDWIRLPPIAHDSMSATDMPDTCGGVVCGHFGQIAAARERGLAIAADLFLNTYNSQSLAVLQDLGVSRATLSLEVDAKEAAQLATKAPHDMEVEVVVGGQVFSMLTRQDYGLRKGEQLAAVSEHRHGYLFEAESGVTTLYESRELVASVVLKLLVGQVDSVRLDLPHQDAAAVAEIVAAYRRCLDLLAQGSPDADSLLRRTQATHERHAPHGSFTGHLIRGARSLDEA